MNKYLAIAQKAARTAGGILANGFRKRHTVRYKSAQHQGIVTEADTNAEHVMVRMIRNAFPDHAILGEERGLEMKSSSPYLWIIDPLDGTTNYSHGIPLFDTTVALQYQHETVLGVVYQPITNEFFVASKGRGAWRNGKRIHVSNTSVFTKAYGCMEWAALDPAIDRIGSTVFAALRQAHARVRNIASGALTSSYVSSGNADYLISIDSPVWDVAAGMLLVEEAGGTVTDFSGKDPRRVWARDPLAHAQVLCSNTVLHKKLMTFVGKIIRK